MATETITADQCADLLRCTANQVEELTRKGELPGIKIGRSWIYVKADLLDYLAERARSEAAERRLDIQGQVNKASANVTPQIRPRRGAPPALPQPSRSIVAALGQRL